MRRSILSQNFSVLIPSLRKSDIHAVELIQEALPSAQDSLLLLHLFRLGSRKSSADRIDSFFISRPFLYSVLIPSSTSRISNSRSAGFLVPVVSARKVSVQPGPGPFFMLRSTCRVRAPATHISQTSDVRRAARAPARALHLPARTHFSMSLKYLKVCQLSSINGTPENKTDHSVSTKSAAPLVGTPKAVWLACCKVERHRGGMEG